MNSDESDEQRPPIPWPTSGQSLFTRTDNGRRSACLGWAKQRPYGYVQGYRRAADLLFEPIERNGIWMDSLVFPLAFVWRHALELQLKQILAEGQVLIDEDPTFPKIHRLVEIWKLAKRVITELGSADDEIAAVDEILREFEKFDPDATGFRYHQSTKGAPALPGAPEHLDLRNMHAVLSGVWNFFDAVHSEVSARLEGLAMHEY